MRVNQLLVIIFSLLLLGSIGCSTSDAGDKDAGDNDAGESQDGNNNGNDTNQNNDEGSSTLECQVGFGESSACGGDPVGTWTLQDACSDFDYASLLEDACANATGTIKDLEVSGTLTVTNTNWTYSVTGTADVDVSIPSACLMGMVTCTTLQATLNLVNEVQNASCEDDGSDGCDCEVSFTVQDTSAGTYATSGGVANIDNGSAYYYYCVKNNGMLLREKTANTEDPNPVFVLEK